MLEKEGKNIDACTIAVPDFMHATVALACMQHGKHVYLEKPLTRTPWEARLLQQAAVKYKVATQMGNQGFSHECHRVAAEIVWSGEIGDVREAHVCTSPGMFPTGLTEPPPEAPVPSTLDWELWLGGAATRPFSDAYVPYNWRGFLDFGTGQIGNWATHTAGPVHTALKLGAPVSVECVRIEGKSEHLDAASRSRAARLPGAGRHAARLRLLPRVAATGRPGGVPGARDGERDHPPAFQQPRRQGASDEQPGAGAR